MEKQLKTFRRHLRLALVVPLLLAVALAGIFALQSYYLRSSLRAVEHSYLVQMRCRTLLKLFLDMENGLRGYQLTGEQHFLAPYNRSAPQVEPAIEGLMKLTAGDPEQQQLLQRIKQRYEDWNQFSSLMIKMRQNGVPADNVPLNLQGKQIMDEIRGDRDHLLQLEEAHLQARVLHLRKVLTGIYITGIVFSLAFGVVIATFSRRELATVAANFDLALRTAYRRTEELHQSQNWLGAVLGSITDGVIATDAQGRIAFSNEVARQMLAATSESLARLRVQDAIHLVNEYTREPLPDPFREVMHSQRPFASEGHTVLVRNDAADLPVVLVASPIRGDDRAINGVVIVLRDLTEQRRSEQTLQSTEKLASIGRLAATVAHEIHNPLDALGNLLYLVEHSNSLTEPNRSYIRLAKEELERVTSISEQMLTFSRESRQPVDVYLPEVLENVLTLYDARIRRMGVTVVKSFGKAPPVLAYPGEIRQVFSNLIGNALDAMNGPGRLILRTEPSHSWKRMEEIGVRVLVCDTGSGVPLDVRDRLMEPFVTSKGEKGTGLGLWVCRGIVQKYHGVLRYHTSTIPGRSGTCFNVFFPAAANETASPKMARRHAS
jgi:PAS domain S-box-containing protein